MAHSTSKELNKVNAQILQEQAKLKQAIANIEFIAQLTILSLQSQREYQMGKQVIAPIEVDEVVNNTELIAKEYDITFSQETGKLFIASNADGSNVILQFAAYNMHPDHGNLEGLCIDRQNPPAGTDAKVSGIFYIKDLPVDLMEKVKGFDTPEVKVEAKKEEEKIDIGKEYESLEAYEKDHKTGDKNDPFGLIKSNPKTLKAPAGLSRNGRKEWWEKLRAIHPLAFDKGGNWIGFTDSSNNSNSSVDSKSVGTVNVEIKQGFAIGLLRETGVGNLITTVIDARVMADTCFIGRYFQQKNGFVIASTPAQHNTENISAMLFFEKFKTADFVLKGLLKSPSWESKLEGCAIHPVSQLNSAVRTDRNRHIYFITNGVTALKALGSQHKEVEDAKYTEVKV